MLSRAAGSCVVLLLWGVAPDAGASAPPDGRTAVAALAAAGPGFLENGGRLPPSVRFTLDAADRTFFFGDAGVTISLHGAEGGRHAIRFAPKGARDVPPTAAARRPGETNLFLGAREAWRTGLATYGSLTYRSLWPGVDLEWRAAGGELKWECRVAAGADPGVVRFRLTGAESVALDASGALVAATPFGSYTDAAPVAWQDVDGRRVPVAAAFELGADGTSVGLRLGRHDPAFALVIDPTTIVRSTFVGGVSDDAATSAAIDGGRNVYVGGVTRSPEASFPETVGPDLTFNGTEDAYLAKLDSTLKPVWIGYLGGSGADSALAVAVDQFGAAFVGGATQSPNFPIVGPLGAVFGGGVDAFVTRVAASGRSLTWSAVFGGAGEDRALAMALDATGRLAVAGRTSGGLPIGPGYGGGVSDGFAMGIRGDGSIIDWGLYVGGNQADVCTGVTFDAFRNVYLCGNTSSTEVTFPVAVGPDRFHNGGQDAWVAKLDANNHAIAWAGYVGGAALDQAAGIGVDSLGRAYVVGSTLSAESSFPVAVGPHLVHHGKSDAFVARVAADGTALEYCGYVGGSGDDFGTGIAVGPQRHAIVVGTTGSTERGWPGARSLFPAVDSDVTFNGGVHDGFVGVAQPDGTQMATLGYLGGPGNVDDVAAVALSAAGDLVAVGTTTSGKNFPAGLAGTLTPTGGRDVFVTQLAIAFPTPILAVPRLDAVNPAGFDVAVDFTDNDVNETAFELERVAATGAPVLIAVASPAAATGPVHFVDTTAIPGSEYAYRVRGVSATGKGEFSESLKVRTTPSLALKLKKSQLANAAVPGSGTSALVIKYSVQPGAAGTIVDPVANGVTLTLTGAGADQTYVVPANDTAWVTTGSVLNWQSPDASYRFVIDVAKGSLRLDATGLTLPQPAPKNPIRITFRTGGSYGAVASDWISARRGTAYRSQ